MGLRFIDSILSLLAAACIVFSAYFAGHALSIDHPAWAWITAAILLVLGFALGLLTTRRIRDYAAHQSPHDHHPH